MPALKLAPNAPKIVAFLRDDCWKKDFTKGDRSWTSYNYQVHPQDEDRCYWYASERDHAAINKLPGFGKECVVTMEQKQSAGEKYPTMAFKVVAAAPVEGITVKDGETQEIVAQLHPEGGSEPVRDGEKSVTKPPVTTSPAVPSKPTLQQLQDTMAWAQAAAVESLTAAAASTKKKIAYTHEDYRTVGDVLYYSAKDYGVWVTAAEEEVEAEAEEPEAAEEEDATETEAAVALVKKVMDGDDDDLPF